MFGPVACLGIDRSTSMGVHDTSEVETGSYAFCEYPRDSIVFQIFAGIMDGCSTKDQPGGWVEVSTGEQPSLMRARHIKH